MVKCEGEFLPKLRQKGSHVDLARSLNLHVSVILPFTKNP
jgi:hypothetical protein